MKGMTLVVQNIARVVVGFVMVYGLYITLSGHTSPGGGFAGAVVIMAGIVMLVLAFGGDRAHELVAEYRCQGWSGLGALGFVLVALAGFLRGGWFVNAVPKADSELYGSGSILVADAFVCLLVATGLVGVFLALIAGTRETMHLGRKGKT